MTDELPQGEEVLETTPQVESESVSSEFDSLFADDNSTEEAPVSREEFERLRKGVAKYFSEQGTKKEETKVEPQEQTGPQPINPVLKSLYFKSNPEAELVWQTVEQEAKKLRKDPFELYEGSSYFKGEAKAKAEQKKVEEENKSKISNPSSGTAPKPLDINAVKPEDVAKLTPAQKSEWIREQARKERMQSD